MWGQSILRGMGEPVNKVSGILARLRLETRPEHERLERDFPLVRADLTLDDYRLSLERLYSFYAAYEEQLSRSAPKDWQTFLVPRRKTDLLRTDLELLGVQPEKLPRFELQMNQATVAEAIGSIYVTEGSTLGGQILLKHIRGVLRLPDNGPYRFFLGYGLETGAFWRSTREWLERKAVDQSAEQVIAGARKTFVSMHELMCEQPIETAACASSPALPELSECSREPIHTPGSIQPHGVLLVVDPVDLCVVQASANAEEWLGRA